MLGAWSLLVLQGAVAQEQPDPVSAAQAPADEAQAIRLYRTREEQREVGLKRKITPWLTLSGLAEVELLKEDFDARAGRSQDSGYDHSGTVQLGLVATPLAFASAELILEYDTERDRLEADEAFLVLEREPWELAAGKQYTPFGVYFSSFVSGPLVEFGETQASEVLTLTYGPSDSFDLSLTAYRGRARKRERNAGRWDWGLATEIWWSDNWSFGFSYQSDLADADSRLLEDANERYAQRVAGVSGYVLWLSRRFELTLEGVAATGSFDELDRDRNRPWAWNAELVHLSPGASFEVAFRIEGSEELEDEPQYQFGPALTLRAGRHASLTLEYLHGEFDGDLATNDDDRPYHQVDRLGAKLSVAF